VATGVAVDLHWPVAQPPPHGPGTARAAALQQWWQQHPQPLLQSLSLRKNPVTGPLPIHEKQDFEAAGTEVGRRVCCGVGSTGISHRWLEG
jgi:hypothetical protein